jgi:hypothetical protein
MEERILSNLTQLTEEYCIHKQLNNEKADISISNEVGHKHEPKQLSNEDCREKSLLNTEKIMKQYYMLMESLEYRMERHEQLTKFAQKSIKLSLIDQENRKVTVKK